MKHRIAKRSLGRVRAHRRHLFLNLTSDLLKHGAVVTSEAKAKELRRYFEPLVSEAKKELTLARRRQLLAQLRSGVDLQRLTEVAEAQNERPGGYVRLARVGVAGDGSTKVKVELIES